MCTQQTMCTCSIIIKCHISYLFWRFLPEVLHSASFLTFPYLQSESSININSIASKTPDNTLKRGGEK